MRTRTGIYTLIGLLILPAVCLAQSRPVEAAVNRAPDGGTTVQITNRYNHPMTAYVLTTEYISAADGMLRGRAVEYFDSLLNPWHDKTFAPGETRTLRFGPSHGSAEMQVNRELEAAVFEDGKTFGDADTVALILAARKTFFEELGKAISLIRSAQDTHMTREDTMTKAAQQMKGDLAAVQDPKKPEQKRAVSIPFRTLESNLQHNPEVPVGTVEATVLQMFYRLRQALISSKPPVAPPGSAANPSQ